jgi:hypothetical protein
VSFGASCVERIGVATCGDGMLCDATNSDGEGQCTDYCTSTASCPTGYSCEATSVAGNGGASISICRVPPPVVTPTNEAGAPITEDGGQPDAEIAIPDDATTDAVPIQQ